MKRVLILQHLINDGPAYLATWLQRHGIAADVRCTESGQDFPSRLEGYHGLAILGGAMSANDDLPSLRRAEALVRLAMARDVPVIGHCLGGQLMARALGARVAASPAPEVGWQPMQVQSDGGAGRAWFGDAGGHMVFQWHYEAFELPTGAVRLAGSRACPNQAFGLGPHLAMQFHVEVDAAKVLAWTQDLDASYPSALKAYPGTVQTPEAMVAGVATWMAAHHALADRVYGHWVSGMA